MDDDRIWSADELMRLSPEERQRLFEERTVWDLDELPPEYVARIRARGRELAQAHGLMPPDPV